MSQLRFDGHPNDTPIGYFTYTVADDHWSWSDGVYQLHGYEPQERPPTTELMLRHKHPDDAARAFDVLERVSRDGRPFSCYHRIINTRNDVRYVLSVGRGLLGTNGRVEQVTGFFVDLTSVRDAEVRQAATPHEEPDISSTPSVG
jgi:PAS domain-containing protein